MNKKLLSIILVLALTFGPCIMAFATGSTNATRNSLKSQGNIVYTDGDNTVAIYSADLYHIADKLDTFKTSVANQLASIHTYFTSDDTSVSATTDNNVNITHTAPASADSVDPLVMDFDTLLEGLAASQSIPTDVTEYGYPADTNLYITDSGSLTMDSTDATQIGITAATAENLSAGTAAWVNGNLILGTGADNTAYYDLNAIDYQSLTVESVSSSTFTKGKYLYFIVFVALPDGTGNEPTSISFSISPESISNPTVNRLTRLSFERIQRENQYLVPLAINLIYFIDVVDESATVSISLNRTGGSYRNFATRVFYCKLQ